MRKAIFAAFVSFFLVAAAGAQALPSRQHRAGGQDTTSTTSTAPGAAGGRFQAIRDARKRQVVERIDERLSALNNQLTTHFGNALDTLENVLNRISSRADKAAAEKGIDVSAVRGAIAGAQTAIANARAAVAAQAAKTYTIIVTTDTKLRGDVGKSRQALHGDLKNVFELVRTAHDAVRNAAVTLAHRMGVPGPGASGASSTIPAETTSTTSTVQ